MKSCINICIQNVENLNEIKKWKQIKIDKGGDLA
jgi:hypothetical protein